MEDILANISHQIPNKSFISLAKCLELMQKQYLKLWGRRKELGEQIDLVISNSSEDIRNIKITEEDYQPFKNQNSFTEREVCKKKFKQYLEKARLVLICKQETSKLVETILRDVEMLDGQIKEFEYLQENIRLSLEDFVAPELQRRREFDQINKQIAQFQWMLVMRENEAREKFIDTADFKNLPYAIKRILLEFVEEEDRADSLVIQNKENQTTDLQQLIKSIDAFYDKWSQHSNSSFKYRLEDLLNENEELKQNLALEASRYSMLLNKTDKYRAELDSLKLDTPSSRVDVADGVKIASEEIVLLNPATENQSQLVSILDGEGATAIQRLEQALQQLATKTEELECMEGYLSEVQKSEELASNRARELELKTRELDDHITALSASLETWSHRYHEAASSLEAANSEICLNRDLSMRLQIEVEDLKTGNLNLQQNVCDINNSLLKKCQENSELQTELEKARMILANLQEELQRSKQENDEILQQMIKCNQEIESCRAANVLLSEDLHRLKFNCNDYNQTVFSNYENDVQVKQEGSALDDQVADLKSDLAVSMARIDELTQQNLFLRQLNPTSESTTNSNMVAMCKAEMERLSIFIQQTNEKMTEYRTRIDTLEILLEGKQLSFLQTFISSKSNSHN
jgi:predicted  nucleic acid-binding Zn-ribbon protein